MNFLFWNTHKNNLINEYIADIVAERDIDIIILCEYEASKEDLCYKLKGRFICKEDLGCSRIKIFSNHNNIVHGAQSSHYSIQIIDDSLIMCAMHLPSRLYNQDSGNRRIIARGAITDVEKHETSLNSKNSVIVGDFNDNPYDDTCLAADSIHGIPSLVEVERGSRKVGGREFGMFYNPMWGLFGDAKFPPGTYYYSDSNAICPFWNMFDQVLIRPQLKERFPIDNLEILCNTKRYSFIDKNMHPDKSISDHLPLVFSIT